MKTTVQDIAAVIDIFGDKYPALAVSTIRWLLRQT